MNPKKILIASVLKTVDDVRIYKKLACSLAKANKYEIFILGKGTGKNSNVRGISFCCTGSFNRKSLKRIWVQILFFYRVFLLKPDIALITTVELLPIAALLKQFYRFKLVYDVQENYQLNIENQEEYRSFEKKVLLVIIRLTNKVFQSKIDHYLLAEYGYQFEIDGLSNSFTVLENKTVSTSKLRPEIWKHGMPLKMIFTGTISKYSGIHHAIESFKSIQSIYDKVSLKIIGVFHQKDIKNYLDSEANKNPNIELLIDTNPVDHDSIEEQILKSHLGVIGYIPNLTNQNRIPTKLFEYSTYGLPYLLHKHEAWVKRAGEIGGGIVIDFDDLKAKEVIEQLNNMTNWDSTKAQWKEEETILLELFNGLLKKT